MNQLDIGISISENFIVVFEVSEIVNQLVLTRNLKLSNSPKVGLVCSFQLLICF